MATTVDLVYDRAAANAGTAAGTVALTFNLPAVPVTSILPPVAGTRVIVDPRRTYINAAGNPITLVDPLVKDQASYNNWFNSLIVNALPPEAQAVKIVALDTPSAGFITVRPVSSSAISDDITDVSVANFVGVPVTGSLSVDDRGILFLDFLDSKKYFLSDLTGAGGAEAVIVNSVTNSLGTIADPYPIVVVRPISAAVGQNLTANVRVIGFGTTDAANVIIAGVRGLLATDTLDDKKYFLTNRQVFS